MTNLFEKQFKLSEYNTNIKKELVAGFATFITMAYVLATIPNILSTAGFDKSATLVSMVFLIIVTSVAMALYTNRPFALAPGLGSVSVVSGMVASEGIPVDITAGVIVLSGILFIAITYFGLRKAVVEVIPKSLKYSISAGIGFFIALIGVRSTKLIVANAAKNRLVFGDLSSPAVILTIIGFIIILILKSRKVPGYIIFSIILTTIIGLPMGLTKLPTQIISIPSVANSNFLNVDIVGAFSFKYFPFLIALFIPDFFSTFGTVLGVSAKAGYLDENGDLPGIDDCFKVDAISTAVGGLFCMPCLTTYLESSVGIESGGRTGLTVISTSFFFLIALFFAPLALMIPKAATAPALIYIGITMLTAMKNIDYSDFTEYFPAFVSIVFTIFASNIANGICLAIPVYFILKVATGKIKELSPVMYVMTAISILYLANIM